MSGEAQYEDITAEEFDKLSTDEQRELIKKMVSDIQEENGEFKLYPKDLAGSVVDWIIKRHPIDLNNERTRATLLTVAGLGAVATRLQDAIIALNKGEEGAEAEYKLQLSRLEEAYNYAETLCELTEGAVQGITKGSEE